MAWAQDAACHTAPGATTATDADLDIAYALLLADRQWGSAGAIDYRGAALRMLAAILATDVHSRRVVADRWTVARDRPALRRHAHVRRDAGPPQGVRGGHRQRAVDRDQRSRVRDAERPAGGLRAGDRPGARLRRRRERRRPAATPPAWLEGPTTATTAGTRVGCRCGWRLTTCSAATRARGHPALERRDPPRDGGRAGAVANRLHARRRRLRRRRGDGVPGAAGGRRDDRAGGRHQPAVARRRVGRGRAAAAHRLLQRLAQADGDARRLRQLVDAVARAPAASNPDRSPRRSAMTVLRLAVAFTLVATGCTSLDDPDADGDGPAAALTGAARSSASPASASTCAAAPRSTAPAS
ncbi:MAG: hypothetical protein IPH80_29580 [Myxococcales bacterium]|nr:hypothetical protein [Myxococcales bacterium]